MGARSIRRSKLSTTRFQRLSQGDSLVPGGTEVPSRRMNLRRDVCPGLEADSRPNGQCSPEQTRGAQWATARRRLLLEEGVSHDPKVWLKWPTEAGRDRYLEATSATTDQVVLEAQSLPQSVDHPKLFLTATAPGWTTWKRCRSIGVARRLARSTPVVTRRHDDQVCVSMLPREHPSGFLRWPLPATRSKTDTLISPLLPGKPGKSSLERDAGLRRGRVLPESPERQARPKVGSPQAGQVASANWTCKQVQ